MLKIDVALQIGQRSETVTVVATEAATEAQVDTMATNLGELVTGNQMTSLPLNGRSYTDLLADQPGVAPISTLLPNSVIMADVQEHMNGGTSIVANLDSIEEFKVLTNNFDPEYGNYNGGIVTVVTKSGSDSFHGNVFEFLRNTDLDAKGYFDPSRPTFRQNQYGGTLGSPLKHRKVYFFGDFQGTGTDEGVETGLITVPTAQARTGNFSAPADAATLT